MRLCILCEDSKLASEKVSLGIIDNNRLFKGVSESGELPATHWFCVIDATDSGYEKIMENKRNSIIDTSIPSFFLKKNKLKIIK